MLYSHLERFFLPIFFIFILSACTTQNRYKNERQEYADGLLLSRNMTDQFGEYLGDIQYLSYIKSRLLQKLPQANPTNFHIIVLNTKKLMAFSAGGGFILISKGLIKHCKNEAELTFIIAHEIAHKYLGHTSIIRSDLQSDFNHELELAADKLAVAMVISAGYDPYAATEAIPNVYFYVSQHHNNSHPDLEERIKTVRTIIYQSKWQSPGTIDRRAFKLFLKALQ